MMGLEILSGLCGVLIGAVAVLFWDRQATQARLDSLGERVGALDIHANGGRELDRVVTAAIEDTRARLDRLEHVQRDTGDGLAKLRLRLREN
jgi:hypothetical protein